MPNLTEPDTLILESALGFAIFAMDLSGTIIRWNAGAHHILGWTQTEAVGQLGHIIFTEEDRHSGLPEKEMTKALEDSRSLDERWHVRKDRTRFWASGEMMTLLGKDGVVVGLMKIVRDRTDQWLEEQKQLALAKLGEGLANMAQPSEIAALAADLVRNTLNTTAACYATIGEQIRVEGRSISEQLPLTDTQLVSICQSCLSTASTRDGLASSKGCFSAERSEAGAFCVVPIAESGRLVAVFAVVNHVERCWTSAEERFIREIATRSRSAIERRRAEEALRELAANLEKQVERRLAERHRLWANTRDLMAIIDLQGVLNEINPAWTELLHLESRDLVGRSLTEITDDSGKAVLRRALIDDESNFQIDIIGSDQRVHRVNWSLTRDDGVAFLVGRDVTDQLEIEGRLRQAQKMEAIGQLTGGLAHDFNNLLAGILGSIDLLRLRIANSRYDDLERHLQTARTSAHRAAALTHRLLTFSRQQPLDPKPIDMNRLVAGMEELLRRTLHARIELELQLCATRLVLSDAHQLENAILNLVINARDALQGEGRIIIATRDGGLHSSPASKTRGSPPDYACLSVSDNGAGMPPEVVAKVFEPFFTTKPAGQGTGLGLAMIYGFVKQMRGDVDLQTELGKGTTMRLFFPCASEDGDLKSAAAPTSYPRGRGERILVIEDEDIVRTTILEMLTELGYASEGVSNALSATDVLASGGRLDAVIIDWGLPGLNGGKLAELAREHRPSMPACFLTGYNEGDAEIQTLRPNNIILTKPVGIETLAKVVNEMLGGSQ